MSLRHDITEALGHAARRYRARAGQWVHAQLVEDITALLASEPTRHQVARIARGEVKDYMSALAEEAGMAFGGPQDFLQGVAQRAEAAGLTVVRQVPDAPFQHGQDDEWRLTVRGGQLVAVPLPPPRSFWIGQAPSLDERGQD